MSFYCKWWDCPLEQVTVHQQEECEKNGMDCWKCMEQAEEEELAMAAREKMIELIHHCTSCEECRDEDIADHLIANGVAVQKCKVGDVVYQTDGVAIYKSIVKKVIYDTSYITFDEGAIGKKCISDPKRSGGYTARATERRMSHEKVSCRYRRW